MLKSYCVAVDLSRFLSEQVKAVGPGDKRFADLVKLLRAEAALVARLAGSLRLTPRSTWSRTPHIVSSMKPWQIGGDDDGAPVVNQFRGWPGGDEPPARRSRGLTARRLMQEAPAMPRAILGLSDEKMEP